MSLYNRHAAPEPDYSEEEWDAAFERLVEERIDMGWERADAEARIDDLMVWDQVIADRDDARWAAADREIKRRKEEGR